MMKDPARGTLAQKTLQPLGHSVDLHRGGPLTFHPPPLPRPPSTATQFYTTLSAVENCLCLQSRCLYTSIVLV